MNDLILAIDCGTQSLRSIIFDTDGTIRALHRKEYEPYTSPQPGWAEQDPEILWNALVETTTLLGRENPELIARVAGVGITAQRDTMICIDRSGVPLRPAITWLDTRKDPGFFRPTVPERVAFHALGMTASIKKAAADGKVNWIKRNQPEIWERTWKYLQVSTFLIHRLTGEAADSIASMVGHIPIDYKRRRWSGPRDFKSRLFPVDDGKRSRIVEPGVVIGPITAEAAVTTGIRKGTPVIATGSDKACETIGMGVVDESTASLSFGTTATVEVATRRYFEPIRFMPAYCAAVPGLYNPEIEIFRGYWLISWFKNEMGHREMEEAKRSGMVPEELLNRLLDASPPGNQGLMLQPFWGPGLDNPHARGAIVGFGDVHNRSAVYRAIVEGLAYALRHGLETLERRGRLGVDRIAASGGAGTNDRICQITANVLGRPLVRGATYETSALGAAIIAGVGAGLFSGFNEGIARMVRIKDEFHPDVEHRDLYDRLHRIYTQLYPRLEPIYRQMQAATDYPARS
jgi:sugar (pentulose or hexulose) kinase